MRWTWKKRSSWSDGWGLWFPTAWLWVWIQMTPIRCPGHTRWACHSKTASKNLVQLCFVVPSTVGLHSSGTYLHSVHVLYSGTCPAQWYMSCTVYMSCIVYMSCTVVHGLHNVHVLHSDTCPAHWYISCTVYMSCTMGHVLHSVHLMHSVHIDWLIDDRLHGAILRSLEQTHWAPMWFYMSCTTVRPAQWYTSCTVVHVVICRPGLEELSSHHAQWYM